MSLGTTRFSAHTAAGSNAKKRHTAIFALMVAAHPRSGSIIYPSPASRTANISIWHIPATESLSASAPPPPCAPKRIEGFLSCRNDEAIRISAPEVRQHARRSQQGEKNKNNGVSRFKHVGLTATLSGARSASAVAWS